MKTVRVLHVLAPAPFGGLESVVHSLAARQKDAGLDVHVAAIVDNDSLPHPFVSAVEASGIIVHALAIPPRAYRHELKLMRALYTNVRPDVVHTHGYRADVLHGLSARRLKIPWIVTSHGFTGGRWKNRLYERIQRRAFRRSDAVVAVSRPMAAQLKASGVAEGRLHCIPNAWAGNDRFVDREDARRQLGISASDFCVGFIGRLSLEKGPDIFVRALAAAADARIKAVVIGDGALRSVLAAEAATSAPADSVRFVGQVERAGLLIKAFDAVVLSSRTEGTPVVLLEAMAARVPVIATRVGGIPHVVSEREALLTAAEDPAAIASAIHDVLRNPGDAMQRAARAAERLASEFDAQGWQESYTNVYKQCVRQS